MNYKKEKIKLINVSFHCSRFSSAREVPSSVSVAVFEELVVSLGLETTLFLLPSFRWRHLYGPCCAEVLYAVAKPYFADF